MWQAPNQRIRALENSRKREQERAKRPFHIRKVLGQVKAGELSHEVQVILNEVTHKGIHIYSHSPISAGDAVNLELKDPSLVVLTGKVIACEYFGAKAKIISPNPFKYRLTIRFDSANPQTLDAIAALAMELESLHIYTPLAKAA